jgi:GTP-binding protein
VADARAVVQELGKFDPALAAKPRWLVLNKMDLVPEDERASRTQALAKALRYEGPLFAISAIDGGGCRALTFAIQDWLDTHAPVQPNVAETEPGEPTVVTPAPVAPRRSRKRAGDTR